MDSLLINNSYPIEYKREILGFFKFRHQLQIAVSTSEFESCSDMPGTRSDLGVLGIKIARVHGHHFVRMNNWKYIGRLILHVYLVDAGHEQFRIIQIMDICMKPKCTRLGIGTQLMTLITEIAKQNSVKYIFGVLEASGNLDARKHFFVKNGFELVENKHFGLSHICAAKPITN